MYVMSLYRFKQRRRNVSMMIVELENIYGVRVELKILRPNKISVKRPGPAEGRNFGAPGVIMGLRES